MFNWTLPQIGITTAMTIYWGDPLFTRKVVNICMQTTFATWKVTLVFLTYFEGATKYGPPSNLESAIFAGPPNQAWLSTVWTLIKIRKIVTMWIYKRVLLYATASKKLHSLLPQFSLISTIKFAAFCSSKVSRQVALANVIAIIFFSRYRFLKKLMGSPLSLSAFVLENWPVSLTHIHCDDEV